MAGIQGQLAKIATLDDQRKKIDAFKQLLVQLIGSKNIADLKVFVETRRPPAAHLGVGDLVFSR